MLALDQRSLEEEAERKIGWMLKLLFAGTATIVAYQFFPYLGMCVELRIVFYCISCASFYF